MNWNPTFSPVWKWLRDHAAPALVVALADPSIVTTLAGPYAPQITTVLGLLTGLGFLGTRYAKAPAPKP